MKCRQNDFYKFCIQTGSIQQPPVNRNSNKRRTNWIYVFIVGETLRRSNQIENKNKREITPDNTVISATAEVKTYYTSNITALRYHTFLFFSFKSFKERARKL